MEQVLLLKCGELVLKGLNRYKFEDRLCNILKRRLSAVGEYTVKSCQSTVYVVPHEGSDADAAIPVCLKVFGVVAVCRAAVCEKDVADICEKGGEYLRDALSNVKTFRVTCKRTDKSFPLTSPQIAAEVGGYLQDKYPHLKPDMENFELNVEVDVREDHAYIGAERLPGARQHLRHHQPNL